MWPVFADLTHPMIKQQTHYGRPQLVDLVLLGTGGPSRGILTWVSIADELPHKGKGTWRKCRHPVSKTSTTDLPFPLTLLTHISSDDATLGRGHPDPAHCGDP